MEIIGLNESFELYLGLTLQGQVSSCVTSRAIRDLIQHSLGLGWLAGCAISHDIVAHDCQDGALQ